MTQETDENLETCLNRRYPGRRIWLEGDAIVIRVPMAFRKRGGRKEIILPEGADAAESPKAEPQRPLIAALAKAHKWQHTMEKGGIGSLEELARREGVDRSYVRRILRLACLAPDITEAILAGREPSGTSLRRLMGKLPLLWEEQREMLGFASL